MPTAVALKQNWAVLGADCTICPSCVLGDILASQPPYLPTPVRELVVPSTRETRWGRDRGRLVTGKRCHSVNNLSFPLLPQAVGDDTLSTLAKFVFLVENTRAVVS